MTTPDNQMGTGLIRTSPLNQAVKVLVSEDTLVHGSGLTGDHQALASIIFRDKSGVGEVTAAPLSISNSLGVFPSLFFKKERGDLGGSSRPPPSSLWEAGGQATPTELPPQKKIQRRAPPSLSCDRSRPQPTPVARRPADADQD